MKITSEFISRIESKTKKVGECLEYQGNLHQQGYARIGLRRKDGSSQQLLLHRVIAHWYHGLKLSDRKSLACHTCDNPRCIRKEHIYVGTHSSNTMDAVRRGRYKYNNVSTHCPAGHKYTSETTKFVKRANGRLNKRCSICHREHSRIQASFRRKRNFELYGKSRSPLEQATRKNKP